MSVKARKIDIHLTEEEWKMVLVEILCGMECADEEGDFIRSDLLSNITYEIRRVLDETAPEDGE